MKFKVLILFFVMAFIYSSCGNNKPVELTQAADTLKAVVPEQGMMIVAKVFIKADKIKDFTEAAKEMIEKSNQESGCKYYQLFQDPYDNTKFVFVEQYDNQAAVDAHFASDYFKGFGPKVADLVSEPSKIKVVTMAKEVDQ